MASQIDVTVPVAGTPTTESVRNNFRTARDEISTLQTQTEGSPFLRLGGGRMSGPMYLFNDPTDVMMPATKGYVDAQGGGGGGGGIPEAPATGTAFGRQEGAWVGVVRIAGDQMGGLLLLADDPDDPLGAATKRYVDAIADAIIPEPPDNGAVFGRANGEWLPVLPLTGGQVTGSLGTIAIPIAPPPLVPNVFSHGLDAVSGFRLNAYQSAANTYNYLVPNATMSAAGLLNVSGNGTLSFAAAQGGDAGDAITWGPAATLDYKGNFRVGGALTIPTDTMNPTLSAFAYIAPLQNGHFAFNAYVSSAGSAWKYLATGYAGYTYLESATGSFVLSLAPSGGAGATISTQRTFTFAQNGRFTADGGVHAGNFVIPGGPAGIWGGVNALYFGSFNPSTGQPVESWFSAGPGGIGTSFVQAPILASIDQGTTRVCAYSLSSGTNFGFWNNGPQMILGSFDGSFNPITPQMYIQSGSITITSQTAGKPGGGPWADSSDKRIKKVEGDYSSGLAAIMRLRPRRFIYLGNDTMNPPEAGESAPYRESIHRAAATDRRVYAGLVADEVAESFPECVTEIAGYIDGAEVSDLKQLDTGSMFYAFINAFIEIGQRLQALDGKEA